MTPGVEVFVDVLDSRRSFFDACVWRAASQLGWWELQGPLTCEQVAEALGLPDNVRVRQLLDVLVVLGWFARTDGRYQFVTRPDKSPMPIPDGLPGWGALADIMRTGRPQPLPGHAAHQAHLGQVASASAEALWDAIRDIAGRLLDLGGGHGVYAEEFIERGGASATVVDTIPRTETLTAQVEYVQSDLFAYHDQNADVVLLSNVLHLVDPPTARAMLSHAAAMLGPTGRLVVSDLRLDDGRRGPDSALYFALNMAIYTDSGDVHLTSEVAGWIEALGMEVDDRSTASLPHTAILVGTR